MSIVMVVAIAVVLALVPTLLYALFIWWLDRHEKEPLPLLLVAFIWGAVPAIILAILLEEGIGIPLEAVIATDTTREFTAAGLVAPVVEELVKAIILIVLFLAYKREFDNVLDGVVYGAMVGLGFALVENVLYLTSQAYDVPDGSPPAIGQMVTLWFLRSGLFGLNHSMFTAFTGAALGFARSVKQPALKGVIPVAGLTAAMMMHALHNSLAGAVGTLANSEENGGLVIGACLGILASDWGGLLVIIVVAMVSGARETQIIRQTLWEEVGLGRFTPDEYEALGSSGRRWSLRWSVLFGSGWRKWRQLGRFFDLSTELAFRKHRMADGDPIHQAISARDIARLRGEIDKLKYTIVASG